jgi:asparagine synthase (glutamine-hydrolysing)
VHAVGRIALAHRRLSIIDLSDAGAQPMTDGELTIVFNGCIYNHRELRSELGARGHRFASTSDTEVILKSYREWGEDFVDHLVGMFAFALHDGRRDRTLLVRDRLGIKPLYVAETAGGLRFASTLPALLAGGGVDTALDPVGLQQYFAWHSIVPAPQTVLRGVRKIPPATVRTVEADGRMTDRQYWNPDFTRRSDGPRSEPEWRDAVLQSLRTAVRRRTVADIPVGVLLSGGVDSSLIVALLAEAGADDLATFSIGFETAGDTVGDEFEWSDAVARQFGTDHHRIRVGAFDIADAVEASIGAMSEPMASHDVVAFHLLCREVAQHVKVVQSGQGADEVFAGYAYYQPFAHGTGDAGDTAQAFERAFADLTFAQINELLSPEYRVDHDLSSRTLAEALAQPGADSPLDAVLRLELTRFMPDDPVKRVDNMSMAWGLEARVPFLDHELVELVAACPPQFKLAQDGKGLLKDIARPLLPDGLVDRPKGYFPVPAVERIGPELLPLVTDALRSPEAKQRGLVEPSVLDTLLTDETARVSRHGRDLLWQVAVLELWLQRHGIG